MCCIVQTSFILIKVKCTDLFNGLAILYVQTLPHIDNIDNIWIDYRLTYSKVSSDHHPLLTSINVSSIVVNNEKSVNVTNKSQLILNGTVLVMMTGLCTEIIWKTLSQMLKLIMTM